MPRLPVSMLMSAVALPLAAVAFAYFLGSSVPEYHAAWQHRDVKLSEKGIITRVSAFLQLRTVGQLGSDKNVGMNRPAFQAAKDFLLTAYAPLLDRDDVSLTEVNEFSLLLNWKGSKPELKPIMLYGHYDVVPVAEDTLRYWTHAPFGGIVQDGYIWGRGAIDMKGSLIAMLEALVTLHKSGVHRPERTLLLGIGHDEEIGGRLGAAHIALALREQGIQLELLLDEGTPLFVDGIPPLVSRPIAMVATAEKGNAAFRIDVDTPGGHSSMPPTDGTHTTRVIADIVRAIDSVPPPLHMQAPLTHFLQAVAPHAPRSLRGLLAHADTWPLSWLLARVWAACGHGPAAQVRNTAVVTIVTAGVAQNVMPQHGEVIVDMRLLQGQGGEAPLMYLRKRVRSTGWERYVTISRLAGLFGGVDGVTPSEVAPQDGRWWDVLTQAIQETFSEELLPGQDSQPAALSAIPVLPSLLTGGTDSKHLGPLSVNGVYRFLPMAMNRTAGDLGMVHGINERVGTDAVLRAVKYYVRLCQLLGGAAIACSESSTRHA